MQGGKYMNILRDFYNSRKMRITIVAESRERSNLNRLLFTQLVLPDFKYSFHRKGSKIIYRFRLFSRKDFICMRDLLQDHLR